MAKAKPETAQDSYNRFADNVLYVLKKGNLDLNFQLSGHYDVEKMDKPSPEEIMDIQIMRHVLTAKTWQEEPIEPLGDRLVPVLDCLQRYRFGKPSSFQDQGIGKSIHEFFSAHIQKDSDAAGNFAYHTEAMTAQNVHRLHQVLIAYGLMPTEDIIAKQKLLIDSGAKSMPSPQ